MTSLDMTWTRKPIRSLLILIVTAEVSTGLSCRQCGNSPVNPLDTRPDSFKCENAQHMGTSVDCTSYVTAAGQTGPMCQYVTVKWQWYTDIAMQILTKASADTVPVNYLLPITMRYCTIYSNPHGCYAGVTTELLTHLFGTSAGAVTNQNGISASFRVDVQYFVNLIDSSATCCDSANYCNKSNNVLSNLVHLAIIVFTM